MGRSADYSKQKCAIAASLDIIGEPWTLLIVRDAFRGVSRFEQWQDGLGLARNVLAARLKHLVAHGIFETQLYCERPKRYEYVLTHKGHELSAVIVHMMDWGQRHVYGEDKPEIALSHDVCGHALTPVTYCAECNAELGKGELKFSRNPAGKSLAEIQARHFTAETVDENN